MPGRKPTKDAILGVESLALKTVHAVQIETKLIESIEQSIMCVNGTYDPEYIDAMTDAIEHAVKAAKSNIDVVLSLAQETKSAISKCS